jgi:hypothetical protein
MKSIFVEESSPDLKKQKRCHTAVMFNTFFWQIISAIAFLVTVFKMESVFINVLFFFSLWTQLLIDVLSCYILWDSFRRIQSFSKVNENLDVNEKMVRLHILSYSLFLVSLLLYFGSYVMPKKNLISLMTILVSTTNTVSQAILGYIFLRICNGRK